MNSRDWLLMSTAAAFGALSSSCAWYILFDRTRKWFSATATTTSSFYRSGNAVAVDSFCSPGNDIISGSETKSQSQSPFDPSKRKGYLSWDDYFMAIAFLSAERSKDPNRQGLATMDSHVVVQMTSFLGQRNPRQEILWRLNIPMFVTLKSMLSLTQIMHLL